MLPLAIVYGLLARIRQRHGAPDQCTYHKDIVLTMLVSGGLVGLAGTMDLIGISSYWLFQPAGMNMLGPGFIGVAVAFRPD